MTVVILFMIFVLSRAHVVHFDIMDGYGDKVINECVDYKTRCNPSLELPCCDSKNTCEAIEVYENRNIFACIKSGQLNKPCEHDFDCLDYDYAICNIKKNCECVSNHIAIKGTKCVALLGGSCEGYSQCIVDHSICIDFHCQCEPAWIPKSNDRCVPTKLAHQCNNDDDCGDLNHIQCSPNNLCLCRKHHLIENAAICKPMLGGHCLSDRECPVLHSACIEYKCQCRDNFEMMSHSECRFSTLGMDCENFGDCDRILYSKCSDYKQCICKQNYVPITNVRCGGLLGEFCVNDQQCAVKNSGCFFSKCECKFGYTNSGINKCFANQINVPCETDYDCDEILHAVCSPLKICMCRENHVLMHNSTCVPLLGGFCDYRYLCKPSNSYCLDNECQCKPRYVSTSHGACQLSK